MPSSNISRIKLAIYEKEIEKYFARLQREGNSKTYKRVGKFGLVFSHATNRLEILNERSQ